MAEIAVLIPNYNRSEYIGETIESARAAQLAYPPALKLHVLAGDDVSTDDSLTNLEKIKLKYAAQPNFSLHIFPGEENRGPNAVINRLIPHIPAACEFSVVIDSDDCFEPNFFSDTLPALGNARNLNPKTGFVYTDCTLIRANGERIKKGLAEQFDRMALLYNNYIPQPALITTQCLKDPHPYREDLRTETSQMRYIQLCGRGWLGAHIEKSGFLYRMHDKNISGANGLLTSDEEAVPLSRLWRTARVPEELIYRA